MKTQTYTLITGASSGIGQEMARIAARQGHHIVLVARSKERLNKLARALMKQYGIDSKVIALDLAEPGAIPSLMKQLQRHKITVDTLINNAGFGDYGPFVKSDLSTQLAIIDLNIRALTELTHALLPTMLRHKSGRIMNVASIAGFIPGPLMSVYFASKAYVLHFSEALAEELRGSNVSVTCLCPGSTKTNFGNNAGVSKTHSTRTSKTTARDVAEFGWKAMLRGTPVAVHGFNNRTSVWLLRVVSRRMVRKIVHSIQK